MAASAKKKAVDNGKKQPRKRRVAWRQLQGLLLLRVHR
jgi:hypothetical protein